MQSIHCPSSRSVFLGKGSERITALHDQYNIDFLLSILEESKQFSDVKLFSKIAMYPHINRLVFFDAILHSIFKQKNDQTLSKIICFLEILSLTNDYETISISIARLIKNFELWILDPNFIKIILSNVVSFISFNAEYIKFDKIAEEGALTMLCNALFFEEKNKELIFELISVIAKRVTMLNSFLPVIKFTVISPYFKITTTLEETLKNTLLIKNSQQQNDFAELVLAKEGSLKEMQLSDLIQLAYCLEYNSAKQFILECIPRMKKEDKDFLLLPIISRVTKRFSDDLRVWKAVFSEIADTDFVLSPDFKFEVKWPQYISILFEMFTSFIDAQVDDFKLISDILEAVLSQASSMLTKPFIRPYFLDFIASNLHESAETCPDLSSQSGIPEELKESFMSKYKEWKEHFDATNTKVIENLPPYYVTTVATILSDVTMSSSNMPLLLQIICKFSHSSILQYYLCFILSSYTEASYTQSIGNALSCACAWISYNRSEDLSDGSIYQRIIGLYYAAPESRQFFRYLFIERLNTIAPHIIEQLISVFIFELQNKFDGQTLVFCVYFLIRLLKSNLPKDNQTLNSFFVAIKEYGSHILDAKEVPYITKILSASSINDLKLDDPEIKTYDDIYEQSIVKHKNYCEQNTATFEENTKLYVAHAFYTLYMKSVITQHNYRKLLARDLDLQMRKKENFDANLILHNRMHQSQTTNPKEGVESYMISPFFDVCTVPIVLLPSKVHLYQPGEKRKEQEENNNFAFFDFKPKYSYGKSLYEVTYNNDLRQQLETVYGAKSFANVIITRLYSNVLSVLFYVEDGIMCLIGATFSDNTINLLNYDMPEDRDKREEYLFMKDCIFEGDYGPFSLFVGHPIIYIHQEYVKMYNYIHLGNPRSVQVFSKMNGVFIIEFLDQQPTLTGQKFDAIKYVDKWLEGKITNFDYLLAVNQAALRSFVDLTCYPIFPRVINDFASDIIGNFRDLSQPIQIVGDNDPEHKILVARYNVQKYHHAENLSNPHFVSSFLIRISPFCNAQWELNGKWEAPSRLLLSIPNHFTITCHTLYEIVPEVFCFVECLENVNKLVIQPDNVSLDVVFPKWANNADDFIKTQRQALESSKVRLLLGRWLDTVFGYKLKEPTAITEFNTYSPMSYVQPQSGVNQLQQNLPSILAALLPNGSQVKLEQREWISACGQVPQQVFRGKHPDILQGTASPDLGWDEIRSVPVEIYNEKQVVKVQDLTFQPGIGCIINATCDGEFLILTTQRLVTAFVLPHFVPLSFLYRPNAHYSASCSTLMVCATAIQSSIIIWSLANGCIISIIELDSKPISLGFLRNTNFLVVKTEGYVKTFTPSGKEVSN